MIHHDIEQDDQEERALPPGPYCPVCHMHGTHGPRCEGIGWKDGVGEPIEETT